MLADTCLGFNVACGTMFKGGGVVLAGFILFIGSVYVLLAAVFGRWMGYLVLMVAFSGWMIIQSSIWIFGFWSQGPDTKTNLGPRGSEPAWQVVPDDLQAQAVAEWGRHGLVEIVVLSGFYQMFAAINQGFDIRPAGESGPQ